MEQELEAILGGWLQELVKPGTIDWSLVDLAKEVIKEGFLSLPLWDEALPSSFCDDTIPRT